MRISKLWSIVCAATFFAGFLAVRAQDNPAQAASRAALIQKMGELNAQPVAPANPRMAPAIIVTPTGTTVALPGTSANPTPAIVTPASENDTPAQAAARAELMKKIGESNAQPSPPANQKPTMASPPPVEAQFAPAPISSETLLAPAPANDTAAQAAARAALMQKMGELNAQPSPPATAVIMTPTNKPATAKAKPAPDQSAADLKAKKDADRKAAEQKAADDAAAKAKAQADARQAAADLKAQKDADRKAAEQKAADEAAAKAKAKADARQAAADLKAKKDAEAAAQKQAHAQTTATPPKVAATPPAKPAVPEAAPVVKPPPPANANYPGKSLGLPPYVAPPPPVSAQQEAQLQDLLAKYMANQISPDEYQKERAAILAGH
jgi:flagellar biosynthesis GTPase FlhF